MTEELRTCGATKQNSQMEKKEAHLQLLITNMQEDESRQTRKLASFTSTLQALEKICALQGEGGNTEQDVVEAEKYSVVEEGGETGEVMINIGNKM